jgi:hypothetical protein
LQTYHIYENYGGSRIEEVKEILPNVHKLDMSMPFGVSMFPSVAERDRIAVERSKYELRAIEQLNKIIEEEKINS